MAPGIDRMLVVSSKSRPLGYHRPQPRNSDPCQMTKMISTSDCFDLKQQSQYTVAWIILEPAPLTLEKQVLSPKQDLTKSSYSASVRLWAP
ncbi:hypothetical protein TNCV_3395301 [Trichonephila clavipes]|nr:hypothetical protein TNCV_3395301 [Trichonephila clavipes]